MTKTDIIEALERIWDELDAMQEEDVIQDDPQALWDIGEAMGAVANTQDDLNKTNNED